MTQPKPIDTLKLAALICCALLLLHMVSGRRLVAAVETASFHLSLSLSSDPVRFRTISSDSGQSGLGPITEYRP